MEVGTAKSIRNKENETPTTHLAVKLPDGTLFLHHPIHSLLLFGALTRGDHLSCERVIKHKIAVAISVFLVHAIDRARVGEQSLVQVDLQVGRHDVRTEHRLVCVDRHPFLGLATEAVEESGVRGEIQKYVLVCVGMVEMGVASVTTLRKQ